MKQYFIRVAHTQEETQETLTQVRKAQGVL